MADSLDFCDEKLIDQLRLLGYSDIPEESLRRFKEELIVTCSEFTNSNLSDNNHSHKSSTPTSTLTNSSTSATPSFSSRDFSPIETGLANNEKESNCIDSSAFSTCSSSGKGRKPVIRKNVRKINGKSMVIVESRSETSRMENTDVNYYAGSSSSSFSFLTPEAISTASTYNTDRNFMSSMSSHTTPYYDSHNSSSDLKNPASTMDVDENSTETGDTVINSSSVSSSVRKFAKRKALRSINGDPIVSIEKLPKNAETLSQFSDIIDSAMSTYGDSSSCLSESDLTLNKLNVRPRLKRCRSEEDIISNYRTKSFIRPSSSGPYHQRNRKSDPVQRYHEYRQFWKTFKVPGEKSHKNLRWMIREHMMAGPVIQPRERNAYSLNPGGQRIRRSSAPWQN